MNSTGKLGCCFRLAPALLAMLLILDCGLNAQRAKSSWSSVEQSKGQMVTVLRTDHRSQTGQLEQTSSHSLTITGHEGSTVISRDEIREVSIRISRSRKKSALWGFALGAGGGAVAGAAIARPCGSGNFCIEPISRGQAAGIGAAGGAAMGSLLGAVLGGGSKKVRLYLSGISNSHKQGYVPN